MEHRERSSAVGLLARTLGVLAVTAVGVWWLVSRLVPDSPSVLLITLDSLRANALSLYGAEHRTSPNLDEFAQRCYVFDRAFAQHYYTGPGHSSILTSLYPRSHGVFRNALVLDGSLETLAEHFRRRRYRTGAIVNVGLLSERFNYQQGFQHFRYVEGYPEEGEGRNIIVQALEWIGRSGRRPFFCWLHLNYTHSWYDPPLPFDTLFTGSSEPSRRMLTYYALRKAYADGTLTEEEVAWARARYDGDIAYTDDWLGILLGRLLEDGVLDHTIVVVTADHGEAFNLRSGRFGHARHLQDEVLRIPLVLYVPPSVETVRSMQRLDAMVQQIDIGPTLVELTGGRIPAAFQGRSLVALMRGVVTIVHDSLIAGAGHEWHPVAVRTDRWKLIQHQEKPTELYDLSADPSETTNVYEQFPEEARALEQRSDAWRRETLERVGVEPEERAPGEVQEVLRNAGYLSEEADGL